MQGCNMSAYGYVLSVAICKVVVCQQHEADSASDYFPGAGQRLDPKWCIKWRGRGPVIADRSIELYLRCTSYERAEFVHTVIVSLRGRIFLLHTRGQGSSKGLARPGADNLALRHNRDIYSTHQDNITTVLKHIKSCCYILGLSAPLRYHLHTIPEDHCFVVHFSF
jgi:hypothetical protein